MTGEKIGGKRQIDIVFLKIAVISCVKLFKTHSIPDVLKEKEFENGTMMVRFWYAAGLSHVREFSFGIYSVIGQRLNKGGNPFDFGVQLA